MNLYLLLFVVCFAVAGQAADLEMIALRTLSDDPLALFVANDDGERFGTTVGISIEAVRAITNRADVLALAAAADNTPSPILPNLIVADDAEIIFGRWQYVQDPDTGELIPLGPVHGSPWLSKAQRESLGTNVVAQNDLFRDDLKAVRDLARTNRNDFVGVASNALVIKESVQAIPVLMTTNQWTRQQCNAIRTALIDLSTELRRTALNNRQASGDSLKTINALLKDSAPGGE